MPPALIGDGEEGGPVLPGKADGLTRRLLARAVLLIPGVGGVLCGYLPCFHHPPPLALQVVGSGSGGIVGRLPLRLAVFVLASAVPFLRFGTSVGHFTEPSRPLWPISSGFFGDGMYYHAFSWSIRLLKPGGSV